VKLGLVLLPQNWRGGPASMGPVIRRIATTAEDAGLDSIWVVDHLLPPPEVGGLRDPILEGYLTLAHLAAVTSRVELGTLVTGVTQRHPGHLLKIVTTLDILSAGRAWLGIGAAWFKGEHTALGIPFPALDMRLELLEETLQIAHQMWNGDEGPYNGKHYQLAATINSPPPLSRPRPPILIGGSGTKKTLSLVARYADACNLFPDTLERGLIALHEHCEREGRDYDRIEKTVYYRMDVGVNGSRARQVIEELAFLADAGAQTALCELTGFDQVETIEMVGELIRPAVAPL
jgi:F420-dependent oxidoreductase-like protein